MFANIRQRSWINLNPKTTLESDDSREWQIVPQIKCDCKFLMPDEIEDMNLYRFKLEENIEHISLYYDQKDDIQNADDISIHSSDMTWLLKT